MNALIVAVVVNIALVNADAEDDIFERIIKVFKGRRSLESDLSNDPLGELNIMPGFYMQEPSDMLRSLFKPPFERQKNVAQNMNIKGTGQNKPKTPNYNAAYKNQYMNTKLSKGVKNLNKFWEKNKTVKPAQPVANKTPNNIASMMFEKLMARLFSKGGKSENNYVGNKKTNIDYKKEDKMLVEKMLTQALNEIKLKNLPKVNQGFSYIKPKQSEVKMSPKESEKLVEQLLNHVFNDKNYGYRENGMYDVTEELDWNTESNNLLADILQAVYNFNKHQAGSKTHPRSSLIVIRTNPSFLSKVARSVKLENLLNDDDNDNSASEITDVDDNDDYYSSYQHRSRRAGKDAVDDDGDSEDDKASGDTEIEKNPGNPYTIHKNKYKQNWPWNHFMDGDHINLNPFGPQFASLGPSGPELFFGRKWWYFNQDDYKPMG